MLIASVRRLAATCRVAVVKRGGFASPLRFGFAEGWERATVLEKLRSDIEEMKIKIGQSKDENVGYFQKEGWRIDYNAKQTSFTYSKTEGEHEIRVLTQVKYQAPPPLEDKGVLTKLNNTEALKQSRMKRLHYSHVLIGIKKVNQAEWLCSDFSIFEGSVQMLSAFFSPSAPALTFSNDSYHGPILSTLQESVTNILSEWLQEVGLSSRMIVNMAIHSTSKVDQINLAWLQNVKDIWE